MRSTGQRSEDYLMIQRILRFRESYELLVAYLNLEIF